MTAAATGTASATAVPSRCVDPPALISLPFIQAMPAPANSTAPQVRGASRWPSATRASKAVSSGAIDIVTSTLATVVSVSATMKAVNMTLQHSADTHRARPPLRSETHKAAGPRSHDSSTTSASALKPLRQNVISKLRAASSWRVTTPAMLHIRAAAIIARTARRWVMNGKKC